MSELSILLRKLRFACIVRWREKEKWLKRHDVFYSCGNNILFQPRKLPNDPKLIKLHNNIAVAAEVCFENHDVIHYVIGNISPKSEIKSHIGCIEIMDNVFIGAKAMIMPNVKIGPNVIVAAGSIVTKDVPPGTVVAGVPARIIGSFDDIVSRRIKESCEIDIWERDKRIETEWLKFYKEREEEKKCV